MQTHVRDTHCIWYKRWKAVLQLSAYLYLHIRFTNILTDFQFFLVANFFHICSTGCFLCMQPRLFRLFRRFVFFFLCTARCVAISLNNHWVQQLLYYECDALVCVRLYVYLLDSQIWICTHKWRKKIQKKIQFFALIPLIWRIFLYLSVSASVCFTLILHLISCIYDMHIYDARLFKSHCMYTQ